MRPKVREHEARQKGRKVSRDGKKGQSYAVRSEGESPGGGAAWEQQLAEWEGLILWLMKAVRLH